jgi:hypothetical protein
MGSVDSVTGATLWSWLVAVDVVDTVVFVVIGLDRGTYAVVVVVVVVGGCCDMVFVIIVVAPPPPYILLGVDAGVGGSCVGMVLPFEKVVSDGFFQVPLFEYCSCGGCCCDDDDVSIHRSEIATTDDGDAVVVAVAGVAFVVAVVPVESY